MSKIYVHGSYPVNYEQPLLKDGIELMKGQGKITAAKLHNADALLALNPLHTLTDEEQLDILKFDADGGGIVVNLYANGIADFEKRLKDPFWRILSDSEILYFTLDPFVFDLRASDGNPLKISSYIHKPVSLSLFRQHVNYEDSPITNRYLSKIEIEKTYLYFETTVQDSQFKWDSMGYVDVGDNSRTTGEN